MREQMKEDRAKSLAIHKEKFGKRRPTEKSTSVFDNTARPLPMNLYLDCKEWEAGIYKHEAPILWFDYTPAILLGYHTLTKVLPLAILLYLA